MTRHLQSVPATLQDLAAQDASLEVDCPLCHVERDAYCVSAVTGQHLHNRTSHWQRIRAAQETTT